MRCDIHPDHDAVGTCTYCGRGVCEQCMVRMYDKVHCKECVEAGRVRGAPQPVFQPQMQYPQPYPAYPNPYYPAPNVPYRQPKPVGKPDPGFFRSGMYGSIYCGIVSIVNPILIIGGIIVYTPEVVPDFLYLFIYLLMLPGLLLVLRGYVGFFHNYGYKFAYQCGMVMIIAMAVDLVLWTGAYFIYLQTGNVQSVYSAGVITFGIVLLFAGLPLGGLRYYLFPRTQTRSFASWAGLFMVLGGLLFLVIEGSYVLGWALAVLAFFILSRVFATAPVPMMAEAPKP